MTLVVVSQPDNFARAWGLYLAEILQARILISGQRCRFYKALEKSKRVIEVAVHYGCGPQIVLEDFEHKPQPPTRKCGQALVKAGFRVKTKKSFDNLFMLHAKTKKKKALFIRLGVNALRDRDILTIGNVLRKCF